MFVTVTSPVCNTWNSTIFTHKEDNLTLIISFNPNTWVKSNVNTALSQRRDNKLIMRRKDALPLLLLHSFDPKMPSRVNRTWSRALTCKDSHALHAQVCHYLPRLSHQNCLKYIQQIHWSQHRKRKCDPFLPLYWRNSCNLKRTKYICHFIAITHTKNRFII